MANKPDLPWQPPSTVAPDSPADWVQGFSIGDQVQVERPFILAPMSGVTDTSFRCMVQKASRGTVGMFVTEFISIEGLRRLDVMARTRMAFDPVLERPLAVQIFGADLKHMVQAAKVVQESGAHILDINCGCPAPKVVRRGGGAEMMRQRDRLARLVEATVEAVDIPVTVKIRSGWCQDSINAVDVARTVERAGATMLAVHGRTRVQLYSGVPDWELISEVVEAVQIPVVGSGYINCAEVALDRLRESGCAAVMIGRAAIMNPWIFGQIDELISGRAPTRPSNRDRLALLHDFHDQMVANEAMPEKAIPGRLKQLLSRLVKSIPHGMLLRSRVLRARSSAEMFEWIEGFFEAADAGQVAVWAEQAREDQLKCHGQADDAQPVAKNRRGLRARRKLRRQRSTQMARR